MRDRVESENKLGEYCSSLGQRGAGPEPWALPHEEVKEKRRDKYW